MPKPRICIVTAVPLTLEAFLAQHIRVLAETYDVSVVSSARPSTAAVSPAIPFRQVAIERPIAPWRDLRALSALWRLLRRERFEVVLSVTPKAGLLAMTAARMAGVPVRIHWFTGQVWATRRGAGRAILKAVDRVLARNATHLLADSHSQREFLHAEGVVPRARVAVLAQGSISGVDVVRFRPDPSRREAVRARLGIPSDAIVALFVGRLTREKGTLDLAAAFAAVAPDVPDLHLVLAGPDEEGVAAQIASIAAQTRARVHAVDKTAEPEAFMAAADLFVLPSYREGFGTTVIEAAACGIPAIASRIYGLTDAVSRDTGILVERGDVAALAAAICELATDPDRRRTLGDAARARAEREFSQSAVTAALVAYCREVLGPA